MEVVGWIVWLIGSLLSLAWSVVWFLLGGWVATLAQIGVVVLLIFGYKYGWRRAPQELLARTGTFGRFVWGWIRSREPSVEASEGQRPRAARTVSRPRHEPGDVRINVSTTLSLLMIVGLGVAIAAL